MRRFGAETFVTTATACMVASTLGLTVLPSILLPIDEIID